MPIAKRYFAALPANGSNAIAASSAVPILVIPALPSVAADVTMMANITNTPLNIPAITSPRIARK